MIKVFASDIDHTMYSSETREIPARTVNAVKRLIAQGVTVVLASSRGYDGVLETVRMFDLEHHDGYVVVNNGAYVVRMRDGKVLSNEAFSHQQIAYLYEKSQQMGVGFMGLMGNYNIANNWCDIVKYNFENVGNDILITSDPVSYLKKRDVFQLSFFDDHINMYEFIKTLDPEDLAQYNFNVPQPPVVDIALKHVNKMAGLQKVLDDLQVSRDEVATMGDNNNDVPMFLGSAISGCVANGSELAKQTATYLVSSDADGGAGEFIEKYLLEDGHDQSHCV